MALESLSEQVRPAAAQIFATGFTPGEGVVPSAAALLSRQQGSGSGVILGADGYVITNAHVIENASRIRVELALVENDADGPRSVLRPRGEIVGAQVVDIDQETDLALLKLQLDRPLPVLDLGDSEALRPGELVMAFGSPLGLATSVSMGVVSAVARQPRADDPMIYIQTDATINPSNSDGPLVDADGRVVWISAFILSQSGGSDGIGFAVPSNIVRTVYEQLNELGRVRRGEVGALAQTITREMAHGLGLPQPWGVLLSDVYPRGRRRGWGSLWAMSC